MGEEEMDEEEEEEDSKPPNKRKKVGIRSLQLTSTIIVHSFI